MSLRRIGTRGVVVGLGVLMSLALTAAPSWAAKGGNSANAALCEPAGPEENRPPRSQLRGTIHQGRAGGSPVPAVAKALGTAWLRLAPSDTATEVL